MDAPRDPIEDPGSKNGMEPIEFVQLPERLRDQYGDEAVDYLEALKEVDLETTAVPETSSHRSPMSDFANPLDWFREMRGDQFSEKLKRRLTAFLSLSPWIGEDVTPEEFFEKLTLGSKYSEQVSGVLFDPGDRKSMAAAVGFPHERICSGDVPWEDLWPYVEGFVRADSSRQLLRAKLGPFDDWDDDRQVTSVDIVDRLVDYHGLDEKCRDTIRKRLDGRLSTWRKHHFAHFTEVDNRKSGAPKYHYTWGELKRSINLDGLGIKKIL